MKKFFKTFPRSDFHFGISGNFYGILFHINDLDENVWYNFARYKMGGTI